jgi:chromate reductase, NAD(P)H dehydrogenase (quinone)
MRIVAISGSLRARSANDAILRALSDVAHAQAHVVARWDRVGELPWFNPDLDGEGAAPPPVVADLRAVLRAADAVVLCTPEYAHGVPGALKNVLDWLVSDGALVDKPVAVVAGAPSRGEFAYAQLTETLRTMHWRVVDGLRIQTSRALVDDRGDLADAAVRADLAALVARLAARSSPSS